jgi:hypothetical protein
MNETKDYKEERFEFALYVNNNVICKRNFKINNFIEHSMETAEFKNRIDSIVETIKNDLKSKSRVYTWYYFNPEFPDANKEATAEFTSPLIKPWECTFKFVVSDNKRVVISKIWDGGVYPKAIRDKVDLANKTVKITLKDGKTLNYDKETYFKENEGRLSPEMEVMRAMIMDKQDLLLQITKKICETCSPRENGFKKIGDYTMVETFKDSSNKENVKSYNLSLATYNKKVENAWAKALAKKTKQYFSTLY